MRKSSFLNEFLNLPAVSRKRPTHAYSAPKRLAHRVFVFWFFLTNWASLLERWAGMCFLILWKCQGTFLNHIKHANYQILNANCSTCLVLRMPGQGGETGISHGWHYDKGVFFEGLFVMLKAQLLCILVQNQISETVLGDTSPKYYTFSTGKGSFLASPGKGYRGLMPSKPCVPNLGKTVTSFLVIV